jgi:hypothetical protein
MELVKIIAADHIGLNVAFAFATNLGEIASSHEPRP